MIKLTLLETTRSGQVVAGTLVHAGSSLTRSGPTQLLDLVLNWKPGEPVEQALRAAPSRFDGTYLRALLEES